VTAWTDPRTYTASEVLTDTVVNTHWRDNLSHLKETVNQWGFPYTFDPRRIGATSMSTPGDTQYLRCYGRGTITKIRIKITSSSSELCVAAYRNSGTGLNAVPAARLATSDPVTCPAVGSADVALTTPATVEPGDWLAWSQPAASTANAEGNDGSTGTSLPPLRLRMDQSDRYPCPDTADPDLSGSAGSTGATLIGVA
jgi:hypothetical protein